MQTTTIIKMNYPFSIALILLQSCINTRLFCGLLCILSICLCCSAVDCSISHTTVATLICIFINFLIIFNEWITDTDFKGILGAVWKHKWMKNIKNRHFLRFFLAKVKFWPGLNRFRNIDNTIRLDYAHYFISIGKIDVKPPTKHSYRI